MEVVKMNGIIHPEWDEVTIFTSVNKRGRLAPAKVDMNVLANYKKASISLTITNAISETEFIAKITSLPQNSKQYEDLNLEQLVRIDRMEISCIVFDKV
jgi:hypothetical protein